MNEINELKSEIENLKKEYDQAKLKYDVARTGTKNKQVPRAVITSLEDAKKALDCAELACANKLQDIRVKKEYEVLERLCTYIFAEANFYYEGYNRLSKLEPSVRELMNKLVHSQKVYLEGKDQIDLDQIIAQQKLLPSFTPIEIDTHFKEGYVNTKKKNNWTKRWLVVNKGLLFLYKNWKDIEPVKCANLLLCTIKQVAYDRPNTLMVISPDMTLTVQAADAEDLKAWVSVIQAGIRWQETKNHQHTPKQKDTSVRIFFYHFISIAPERH